MSSISGPKFQTNIVSSYLDGGFIYGATTERARDLRLFQGGLLKHTDMHRDKGMKPLLPIKTKDPDVGCTRRQGSRDQYCFLAGKHHLAQKNKAFS